jgi:Flp pilus assembly protein TadG
MIIRPQSHRPRRGSTLVESAITLTILLTVIFGTLDLGLGVMRFNMISHAAREGVRQAMVHGGQSTSPWSTVTNMAASTIGNPVANAIAPQLVGCDLTQTTITLAWVDGTNEVGQRVRVTINTTYQPFMTYIFGASAIPLQAASTTTFAH